MLLSVSTPEEEGVYQAAKWLKYPVLCLRKELQGLIDAIGPIAMFPLGKIGKGESICLSSFLEEYGSWVETLDPGEKWREFLPAVWTDDPTSCWLQETPKGFITRIKKPSLQVHAHFFHYSSMDETIHSMALSKESFFWGLEFSFPQIHQDPKTLEMISLKPSLMIKGLQQWLRDKTRPTPFRTKTKKIPSSIRIGNECIERVHLHPGLMAKGLVVR